ncbi:MULTISPECIES: MFS transporter [unclassified Roseitalea]|uniref:MFS transporter n=1 Tax=unclassified Roseitalea TaxID=2639107 RepID=UPI00273EE8ED|nr:MULTISPECIES: MFS transporter [unclassified Roseitalea]
MLRHIVPVTGLMLSTFFLLAGSGLTGVLLPLRAGLEGWSPVTIGWIGFGYALCFTAGCVIVPRLVRRVGHVRVYAVLATLLAMSLLLHALLIHPLVWIAFRGMAGFALAGTYMVVESWLNEKATNDSRGQIFSVYMIVNMVGLMAGQFMLILADPATTTLFILAALLYCLAVVPTGLSNAVSPQPLTEVTLDLGKLYRNSPAAVVGMLVAGTVAGIWNFQAPVFAERAGLSGNQIPVLLALAMISGAIFQFPLGRASDRMDRRYVMVLAGLLGVAVALVYQMVPAATSLVGVFVTVFVLGAILFPIYSLVVAHANDYAAPSDFVEISSGLLIIHGLGAMIGPVAGGFMIERFGPSGFFTSMAIAFAVFAGYAGWRITRREAVPTEEMTDYSYMPVSRTGTPETFNLDPRSEESE